MAALVLGPMLRYVGSTEATIWVEVDAACDVEVLGTTARTFCVEGHHYALVIVEGLAPATITPYEVRLDGVRCWPEEGSALPPSTIRTDGREGPRRVLFGSCRAAAPHEPPWNLELALDERGRGVDALRAHGLRMLAAPPERWPDLLLLVGDQVYADDSSPEAHQRIVQRRGEDDSVPIGSVADFEEFTWLYHESWRPEIERWMFSVLPSAMIFDDHDMIDDWNISASWVADVRAEPWWREHVVGGLMSYWIYQHLGNLAPAEIRREGLLAALGEVVDGGEILRRWAHASEAATPVPGGYRFSFDRDVGGVRIVVVDSRNGRVLIPGQRAMVDDEEWAWVVERSTVGCEHLVVATSLPVLLPGGIHDLQVWDEQVADGAWGRWFGKIGERVRRGLDLEDWPAFGRSFDAFVDLLRSVASGQGATPPATICVVSGDVHFSYAAEVDLGAPSSTVPPSTTRVHQLVSSPIRNALTPKERAAFRFTLSRVGTAVGAVLRWAVRGRRPTARWRMTDGPVFANCMGQLTFDGRRAELLVEQASPDDDGEPMLASVVAKAL